MSCAKNLVCNDNWQDEVVSMRLGIINTLETLKIRTLMAQFNCGSENLLCIAETDNHN